LNSVGELIAELKARGLFLAIAESLTGGGLTQALTEVPGSSKVVLGGIVAYQTRLKHELLGVSSSLLEQAGAVDFRVAAQMAEGVRNSLANKCQVDPSNVIGISTTGVAGPDEQDGKPVGKVFVGISGANFEAKVLELALNGDRQEIRAQTIASAIQLVREQI
jgi:nicotinamide-nucleotide amidase